MAESNPGSCPQVFVVDGLSDFISMPRQTKSMWAKVRQNLPLLLLGLTVLGLVLQGFFIYRLYKRTEAFPQYGFHPVPMNQSNPKSSRQQGSSMMGQAGSKEHNEIKERPHIEESQRRPFAHLIGSDSWIGQNNVVLWNHDGGDAVTEHMRYDNGALLVEKKGYYYLYSKVQVDASTECLLIQHRVMLNTSAYGLPIELMRSKSFRCRTKPFTTKPSGVQDLWNSFLAGIFHLQSGDKVFVELANIQKIRPGPADNFMGAFMIFP